MSPDTVPVPPGGEVAKAANEVVDAHKALILGVTPKHPEWCADNADEYHARFTRWHSAARRLRDVLGRKGEYV